MRCFWFLVLASVANGLTITNMQTATLYFEVVGTIKLYPGDCDYRLFQRKSHSNVPLLRCNLTNGEPSFMQVYDNDELGVKIRTAPPSDNFTEKKQLAPT